MRRTTSIRIKDNNLLKDYVFKYRHFENMFLILLKNHKEDFNLLSDYSVMRAIFSGTSGGKVSDKVEDVKTRYGENQLLENLISLSKELKVHNLSMIIRRVKGGYRSFFTKIKQGEVATPPHAKKLSLLTNYSIPLDLGAWSLKRKNQIGLNLHKKMFYLHVYHNRFNAKLNSSISENVTKWFVKDEKKYPLEYNKRGYHLKNFKTFLTERRNQFFKNEFHKLSKRVVEFFYINNITHLYISRNLTFAKNEGNIKLRKKTKQNFIQIPFGKLLDYIQYKAEELGIKVIEIDEAYTSKTSCINGDVFAVQEKAKREEKILTNDYNASRVKRGLLKDKVSSIVFNADINGAVNHIKVATKTSFLWLKDYMFKLANPIKIKSDYEFNNLLLNSVSDKSILNNLRKERCLL